jgi:hypothetical protein
MSEAMTAETGITQEEVDSAKELPEILGEIHAHLEENKIFESEFVFLSCGDEPGTQMQQEAELKKITDIVPSYLRRWINLEQIWPQQFLARTGPPHDFT